MFLLFYMFYTSFINAQVTTWNCKEKTDNIKICTRKKTGSNFKEVKINFSYKGNLASLVSILKDFSTYPKWLYNCKEAKVLEYINTSKAIGFLSIKFPLISDRYIITKSTLIQDKVTKVITLTSIAQTSYQLSKKPAGVQIKTSTTSWELKPTKEGIIHVTHYLHSDPSGNLSPSLVNWLIDIGPLSSIKKIKALATSSIYVNKRLSYIKEY